MRSLLALVSILRSTFKDMSGNNTTLVHGLMFRQFLLSTLYTRTIGKHIWILLPSQAQNNRSPKSSLTCTITIDFLFSSLNSSYH